MPIFPKAANEEVPEPNVTQAQKLSQAQGLQMQESQTEDSPQTSDMIQLCTDANKVLITLQERLRGLAFDLRQLANSINNNFRT